MLSVTVTVLGCSSAKHGTLAGFGVRESLEVRCRNWIWDLYLLLEGRSNGKLGVWLRYVVNT